MADLGRAYTTLICQQPFFTTVLLRLRKVVDHTQPTMWTDGISLGYNPDFVAKLTDDELLGVLVHEIMHVVGLHPFRRAARTPFRWNVACDMVVNHHVTINGFKLPQGCIPPVPDTTPEAEYEKLPPEPPQPSGGSGNDPGAGQGIGGVRDAPGTQAERDAAEQEARITVRQAIQAAKAAGKLPAGMERYCEEALEPKVPWRDILSQVLDGWSRSDYSWTRPYSRYLQSGFILPSLHAPSYGSIVIGADTSGSICGVQLQEICSEVVGAVECYADRGQVPAITCAWFDHAVHPQPLEDVSMMMDLKPQGGGGTSFRVVFEWLNAQPEQPRACIMITDGYCNDWGPEPEVPVLWILTAPLPSFHPPFGTVTCVL